MLVHRSEPVERGYEVSSSIVVQAASVEDAERYIRDCLEMEPDVTAVFSVTAREVKT